MAVPRRRPSWLVDDGATNPTSSSWVEWRWRTTQKMPLDPMQRLRVLRVVGVEVVVRRRSLAPVRSLGELASSVATFLEFVCICGPPIFAFHYIMLVLPRICCACVSFYGLDRTFHNRPCLYCTPVEVVPTVHHRVSDTVSTWDNKKNKEIGGASLIMVSPSRDCGHLRLSRDVEHSTREGSNQSRAMRGQLRNTDR